MSDKVDQYNASLANNAEYQKAKGSIAWACMDCPHDEVCINTPFRCGTSRERLAADWAVLFAAEYEARQLFNLS